MQSLHVPFKWHELLQPVEVK